MATLRSMRKLAAVSRETPEGSRSSRGQTVLDSELAQDYISQVSDEIEGRVTKRLSKEFSKTESRILGALSKLDEFLLNPQVRTCSVAVQGTSGNANSENRETHGNRSSNDPYPEVGYFPHHSGQLNSPEAETNSHMVTKTYPHMVTGGPEKIRHNLHTMTATQEEIPYCSPTTSSGKQKKGRSTNQPQFRSENTPATIEADQILLAPQQLATNSISANFNNNINQISKLPKSLTTFDGKSEKCELFEDLFQTSLKIHNQLTQEDKINYLPSLMRGDALQTFKNITTPIRENLGEILTVFLRKYVKPQSMATAKHKFQRLICNPANQKLINFLDDLQKLAKDAFGVAAQATVEQFIYAKMPPHLKKSINQAHLENGTYEQIVSHLEKELELNGLEAPDETPINTVTPQAPQQNSNKPRPTCHQCKKPSYYQSQCRPLKREKDQTRTNTNSANNNNGNAQTNSNPNNNKVTNNTEGNNINNHRGRKSRPVFPPCETCGRNNHSTEMLPWSKCSKQTASMKQTTGRTEPGSTEYCSKQLRRQCPSCTPSFKLKMPRLHSGADFDRQETKISKLPTNSRGCLAATYGDRYKPRQFKQNY